MLICNITIFIYFSFKIIGLTIIPCSIRIQYVCDLRREIREQHFGWIIIFHKTRRA